MSKAIVIKKNGVNQNLTVDKLRTNGADGQSIDWVPEDTVQLVALNAAANGTYTPTGGKYGFEYATVSVPGSVVTGKKPDGNTYVYTKDGSGALVETKVPSEIRITTMPTNVGPYGQGAYLDFSGIVVKGYYADGTEYGEIPYNDLVFPVTVAQYDPDAPLYTEDYQADFFDEPIITTNILGVELLGTDIDRPSQPVWDQSFETKTGYNKMAYYGYAPAPIAGGPPNGGYNVGVFYASYTRVSQYDLEYTYDGKTVFSNFQGSGGGAYHEWTISPYPPAREAPDDGAPYRQQRIAWTMLYGEKTGTNGGVQIPVQWSRPGDGMVLETAFGISVIPSMSSSN